MFHRLKGAGELLTVSFLIPPHIFCCSGRGFQWACTTLLVLLPGAGNTRGHGVGPLLSRRSAGPKFLQRWVAGKHFGSRGNDGIREPNFGQMAAAGTASNFFLHRRSTSSYRVLVLVGALCYLSVDANQQPRAHAQDSKIGVQLMDLGRILAVM